MAKQLPCVAVVGAGLTGLTAAFYLRRAGFAVTVFDSADHAGGVIQTRRQDGFTWECGPNTGVLGKPEVVELFEDMGCPELLETASPVGGKRYIWKGKRWEAIPGTLLGGLLTPLFSWKDKLGLPFEMFRPRGTDPHENLSSLVRRRLGQSILDYAVDPFVSGVYAGSPDVIIPKYALPKLYNLEQTYGSFIGGSIKKMREPKTARDRKATRKTFSAHDGLQNLVDALVVRIGVDNLRLGCQELRFSHNDGVYAAYDGAAALGCYTHVVSCTGAHALPGLFPFLQGQGFDDAFQVRYATVAEVAIGFKAWSGIALDGFGGLVPSKENRDILGVLFMSSLLQGRAPAGGALFTVFAGGLRHPEYVGLPDAELRVLVGREFCAMMGLADFQPDLFEISRHARAIPQYDLSTPGRLAAMEAIEARYAGLLVGGNGRDGIGMSDRIAQGRNLALRLERRD